ncbi:MAG: hypothetical protein EBR30_15205 [Cytophagia bacterium]|nr:hypothetical protein [Cytophagia bacterium]
MNSFNNFFKSVSLVLFFGLVTALAYAQTSKPVNKENTWTFTYLKANPGEHSNVKAFLERNWLAMDSIAVVQGLINKYELIENIEGQHNPNTKWNFIVAVEYFTRNTYTDIADKFELIRKQHQTIKIEGKTLKELGSILKSETVIKKVH